MDYAFRPDPDLDKFGLMLERLDAALYSDCFFLFLCVCVIALFSPPDCHVFTNSGV